MIREENSERQIYEHAKVSLSMWKNYSIFLKNLEQKVKEIRLNYMTETQKLKMKFSSKFQGQKGKKLPLNSLRALLKK